ncbi:MAG TPA: DUF1015 domain-containing protein [Dissulfurispiraceae bacterium]|nr:DUF1015 domain-containing protein [Dissulfurispiraceae bacterium]
MPKVIPFEGLLFNREKVSGDDVIAPPYDVIAPECKDLLYNKSPYNIVRIDFGKELPEDSDTSNKYHRAAALLDEWTREGILVRDAEPVFYAYEMDYSVMGQKRMLKGIFGLVELVELGSGVYPHEMTHSKPKADRMNLMRHCEANISPIYSIYSSSERVTSDILDAIGGDPYLTAKDADGAVHKLFRISGPAKTELISKELSQKAVFIADGHHRYEVALEFKKEMDLKTGRKDDKPRPWDYVLMFLANMSDEGITILPTHRLIRGISDKHAVLDKLESDFELTECPADADIGSAVLARGEHAFGLYLNADRKWHVLKYLGGKLKDIHPALNNLDVVVLHELILKRDLGVTEVAYEMDVREAVGKVDGGEFDALFFLNPTAVEDIERVASAGLRMPPKSTYFYPKLLTGMVINKFQEKV